MPNVELDEEATSKPFEGIHAEFMEFYAYYMKYTYRLADQSWGISMVVVMIFLIIFCFLMNGLVFCFYKRKSKKIVAFIYAVLSFTDMAVAFGSCFTVSTIILYLSIDLSNRQMNYVYQPLAILCHVSFFVSAFPTRMSIILNTILTVVRTIMILNPFREIHRMVVYISLGVVAAFWMFLINGELYTMEGMINTQWDNFIGHSKAQTEESSMNRKQNLYMWYLIFTSLAGNHHMIHILGATLPSSVSLHGEDVEELAEKVCGYFMFTITFIIPSFVATACLVVQAVALRKSSIGRVKNRNGVVTITIIMLTVLLLVCNSTTVIFCTIAGYTSVFAKKGLPVKDDQEIMTFYRLMFVFQQVLPLINSTLSPVILIWRGADLKDYSKKTLVREKHKLVVLKGSKKRTTHV